MVVAFSSNLFNCSFNVNYGRSENEMGLVMRPCAKDGQNNTSGEQQLDGGNMGWEQCLSMLLSVFFLYSFQSWLDSSGKGITTTNLISPLPLYLFNSLSFFVLPFGKITVGLQ